MLKTFQNKMNSQTETHIYLVVIVILALAIILLKPKVYTIVPCLLVIAAAFYFARKNTESKTNRE